METSDEHGLSLFFLQRLSVFIGKAEALVSGKSSITSPA